MYMKLRLMLSMVQWFLQCTFSQKMFYSWYWNSNSCSTHLSRNRSQNPPSRIVTQLWLYQEVVTLKQHQPEQWLIYKLQVIILFIVHFCLFNFFKIQQSKKLARNRKKIQIIDLTMKSVQYSLERREDSHMATVIWHS